MGKSKEIHPAIWAIGGALVMLVIIASVGMPSSLSIAKSDLRLIALPYLQISDVKDLCINNNAQWREDSTFVGCDGLGPNSCSTSLILAAQSQCLGAGADWYCETGTQGYIYCKY